MRRWTGEPFKGGSLLVWPEQGLGDEILFAGMMDDLADRAEDSGFTVVWEVDPRLVGLMQRSNERIHFVPLQPQTNLPIPDTKLSRQIPSGSLGSIFRNANEMFPTTRRSYLKPDPHRRSQYRDALGGGEKKLIGISWASKSPNFAQEKSMSLSDLVPVMDLPGVGCVDLQYGDFENERTTFRRGRDPGLLKIAGLDLTTDLDGVAAAIAACDHVVTVSNVVAHLAGALGVPVTVLMPSAYGRLWYWGAEAPTTPWYPSARIVRRHPNQSWLDLVSDVARNLEFNS